MEHPHEHIPSEDPNIEVRWVTLPSGRIIKVVYYTEYLKPPSVTPIGYVEYATGEIVPNLNPKQEAEINRFANALKYEHICPDDF